MAEQIRPFEAPQTPPELITLTQSFERKARDWSIGAVRWVEALIRELRTVLSKVRLALNDVNGRVDVLVARTKDIYTFPAQGSLSPGKVALPLRVVADSTLVEVFAAVTEPPEGGPLTLNVLKNDVVIGVVVVPAGQVTGALALAEALVKDVDRLQPEVLEVGSGIAGSDLVVQIRCR